MNSKKSITICSLEVELLRCLLVKLYAKIILFTL